MKRNDISALKAELESAKFYLGLARYKGSTSMFPHPHWEDDIKRLERQIKDLQKRIKDAKGE